MNENIQFWANVSQILSLIILVFTSILQAIVWLRRSQIPVSSFLSRIRPFLPYILTAALFFWIGSTLQQRSSSPGSPIVPPPVTAVTAVTAIAAAPPVTAITAVTAVTVIATPQPTSPPIVVTSPPEVVTATPQPTPTPLPETAPGTVLAVGQTWKQGGVELKLREVKLLSDQVQFFFEFTNRKSDEIAVKFIRENSFFAFDNNNRALKTCYLANSCNEDASYIIPPGDTVKIGSETYIAPLLVSVDTTRPELTEVIVKVVNFSSITEARWRVPISHG